MAPPATSGAPFKYARPEVERRWLVTTGFEALRQTATSERQIEDTYFDATRLRLRKVSLPDGSFIYKLGKKYEPVGETFARVVSVCLMADEHAVLGALPGRSCVKRRYAVHGGSLDLYDAPTHPFAIFEREFASEGSAMSYEPPPFVTREVTTDPRFTGFALCRNTPSGHIERPGLGG